MLKLRELFQKFGLSESIQEVTDATGAVFELAATLKEQEDNNPQIKKLVEKVPTLLDALNSPLGQVINCAVPFLPIATGLINFAIKVNKRNPTIAETIAIIAQAAYLDSIKEILKSNAIFVQDNNHASHEVKKQISKLGDLEIDDKEARNVFLCFHDSNLGNAFSKVLLARLQETRIDKSEIQTFVKRVAINTQRYILSALVGGEEGIQKLIDWHSIGGRKELEKYESIDTYLEEKIEPLPKQTVFKEEFSYQDIYVPLRAIPLDKNGKKINNAGDFVLEKWAQKFIINTEKSDRVIFIEAGAGRGKSVFCRMFADWVRQNLHPWLTPILIQLRDIEHFQQNFEKTLSDALSYCDFVRNDNGWLTDRNTQYLFLLDGFDELWMEERINGGIDRFIRQAGMFQERFRGKETGHRVIMTGRPIALQGISFLPDNLERVELLPMNDAIQQRWLEKWEKVVSKNPDVAKEETKKFKDFLKAEECPKEIQEKLAREPLLLYLLAKLHRPDPNGDRQIEQGDFKQAGESAAAKILIYEKSLKLVLEEQRVESLQHKIIGLNKDNLERILTEAGLCVVQSGGEYAKVEMIKKRLERERPDLATIIKELPDNTMEAALTTALGAFYIRSAGKKKGGGFEFYHKSFSEFFCAKRLLESLEEWTEPGRKNRKWDIDDEKFEKQIYDLLGYGGLTPEIVEYLQGLFTKSKNFRIEELFQRLKGFYLNWCDGKFIDAEGITIPQTKMRQLKEELSQRDIYLGQRQIDVYAGLNTMILLLELSRYRQSQKDKTQDQLNFYPCGDINPDGMPKDKKLLMRLINYSDCIGAQGFRNHVGRFLLGANLSGVDLSRANLARADLSGSDLRSANLSEADLYSADLSRAEFSSANIKRAILRSASFRSSDLRSAHLSAADLRSANLSAANLSGANLRSANLSGANLSSADLSGANLRSANLSGANLRSANLSGADLRSADLSASDLSGTFFSNGKYGNPIWNENTDWSDIKGLDTAINMGKKLKEKLLSN